MENNNAGYDMKYYYHHIKSFHEINLSGGSFSSSISITLITPSPKPHSFHVEYVNQAKNIHPKFMG